MKNPHVAYRTTLAAGTHRAFTITAIRQENERTRTLTLNQPLDCSAGQFVMVWLPGVGEKPFSIAGNDPLTLTIVDVGPISHALHGLQTGERIWLRGPLGQGYQLKGQQVLLAAGGYGAAPLYFLAQQAYQSGIGLSVCLGARSAADILLAPAFEALGARVYISTDDGSLGRQGLITGLLPDAITAQHPDCLYACGPVKMLQALEILAAANGIPAQFSWEAHMRCGIGLCGSCELILSGEAPASVTHTAHHRPGWLTCLDGPVSFYEP
ncbi:MAG: dihydroorotate dehydrogenase electron transfer subunit [Anaerolineae bacterium]|nr:dihydroorotate dehydrogenase electron transfer subunit [Anaerolineae bacterium]